MISTIPLRSRFHRQDHNPDFGIAGTIFQNCAAIAIIFPRSWSSRWDRYNSAAIAIIASLLQARFTSIASRSLISHRNCDHCVAIVGTINLNRAAIAEKFLQGLMNEDCCPFKCFIELYFLSWLFVKISFLLLCRLFSVVHELHARVLKMPRVSNSLKDYGVLEVECKRKWFREWLPTRCVRFFK